MARRKGMDGASFVAIDFETASNDRDSACAIGVAVVRAGRIVSREQHLIRPPTREFRFTHIHGLTWEDVRDAPTFAEVWRNLSPVLSELDFLAAHNASFDRGVLAACCESYRLRRPAQPFVCTVQVARPSGTPTRPGSRTCAGIWVYRSRTTKRAPMRKPVRGSSSPHMSTAGDNRRSLRSCERRWVLSSSATISLSLSLTTFFIQLMKQS